MAKQRNDNLKPQPLTDEIRSIIHELATHEQEAVEAGDTKTGNGVNKGRLATEDSIPPPTDEDYPGQQATNLGPDDEHLEQELDQEDAIIAQIVALESLQGPVLDAPSPPPSTEDKIRQRYIDTSAMLDTIITGSVAATENSQGLTYYGYDSFKQNGRSGIYIQSHGQVVNWEKAPFITLVQYAYMLVKLKEAAGDQHKEYQKRLAYSVARSKNV